MSKNISQDKYMQVGQKFTTNKSFIAPGNFKQKEDDDVVYDISDLNKEYNLLIHYNEYGANNKVASLFSMMGDALTSSTWMFMDLDNTQEVINHYFKYLSLKKKYKELEILSKNGLAYDGGGFHLHEFTFETLDEVKKALDNKAFL